MNHNTTPRAQSRLAGGFANRVYEASPLNPNRRPNTPQTAPARKFVARDANASAVMDSSKFATSRNIFSTSSIGRGLSRNTSPKPFQPQLPAEASRTKLFAPGTTPVSQRVYREATAQATPRGMMAKTNSTELFSQRIPSPPPELSGEALTKKVPAELDAKGTVYADQFLADLVPPEYDDLQRRQLLCILDLRRLKYTANEVFAKKDWKLNVMNFAKEFEKSRGLIMLRYGLYEFKNVKPSAEVVRKWRAAHGLSDPDGESAHGDRDAETPTKPTSSRPASTKRKAEEEAPRVNAALSAASPNRSKRRAVDREPDNDAVATPAPPPNKQKRKASSPAGNEENQPSSKMVKPSTPSATKALFEKAYNNKPTAASPTRTEPADDKGTESRNGRDHESKPSFFSAPAAPATGVPAKSVFESLKPPQAQNSGNIFGYLSDNSAKNSGVDADAESESDSDDAATQEAERQSDEPSVAPSGGASTPTSQQPSAGLFAAKKPLFSNEASANASRESTPGPSLFDRVTKGDNGEPLRDSAAAAATSSQKESASAEDKSTPVPAPSAPAAVNATWSVGSPIKFGSGPSATPSSNIFGTSATSGNVSSIFGQKATPASTAPQTMGLSGAGSAKKPDTHPATEEKSASASTKSASEPEKSGESDKENDTQPPTKPAFGGFVPKTTDNSATPSLFQQKQSSEATPKPTAAPQPIFGASKPDQPAASAPASGNDESKPKESVMQSSTLFGTSSKTTEPSKPPTSLFPSSSASSAPTAAPASAPITTMFGSASQPASGASTLFGSANGVKPPTGSNATGATGAFGGAASSNIFGKPAASTSTSAPSFNLGPAKTFAFGAPSSSAPDSQKSGSVFGATTATPAAAPPTTSGALFGGSPMKQDPKENGANSQPANNMFGGSPMKQDGKGELNPPTSQKLFGGSPMKQDSKENIDDRPTKRLFGGPTAQPSFAASSGAPAFGASQGGASSSGSIFGGTLAPAQTNGTASTGGSSFTFGAGGSAVTNPFAASSAGGFSSGSSAPAGGSISAPSSFTFGAGSGGSSTTDSGSASTPFQFGANAPAQQSSQPGTSSVFNFGPNASTAPSLSFTSATTQPQSQPDNIFAPKPMQPGGNFFGNPQTTAGASTSGTNSPFNFGGASSLATTPATGTPEPTADGEKAPAIAPSAGSAAPGAPAGAEGDDPEERHEQITLTGGGPGEEDEDVVYEVRARLHKLIQSSKDKDSESSSDDKSGGGGNDSENKKKSPWSAQGIGPFRLLKHKTTGAVRMILRVEPRGHVVLNRHVLPSETYKGHGKYVRMLTGNETGDGLETWMVQVKSPEVADEAAAALEKHKGGNSKQEK